MGSGNIKSSVVLFTLFLAFVSVLFYRAGKPFTGPSFQKTDKQEEVWAHPSISSIPDDEQGNLIRYGAQLIANTAAYLGPKGSVATLTNGMNCQNCHLDAGTRSNGNSFGAVAATYPKFRERSGLVESVTFRINDCMQRSLNGKKLDSLSREMKAMLAYINWVGKDVHKNKIPKGVTTPDVPFLNRAANTENGKNIYATKCTSCHGLNGDGLAQLDNAGFIYPPLWGNRSYNVSAGMYRLTRLAAFIKYNMPYVAVQSKPQLTDEEAWDVAAFVASQDRPVKMFAYDWKNLASKPVDYPFGPFPDSFSTIQHKYGPFDVIKNARQKTPVIAVVSSAK